MSKHSEQREAILNAAAIGPLLLGIVLGHVLLGVVCAIVIFCGLAVRSRPGRRVLGNALVVSGALGFGFCLLVTTSYSIGKDMARRDASISTASAHTCNTRERTLATQHRPASVVLAAQAEA